MSAANSTWQAGTPSRAQVDGFAVPEGDGPRHFSIDIGKSPELGGTNGFANLQEYLIAVLNACMIRLS